MVRSLASLFMEDEEVANVELIMPTGRIDDELKGLLKHERTWPEAAELMAARSPGDAACVSDFSLHCITSLLRTIFSLSHFLMTPYNTHANARIPHSRLSTTQAVDIVGGGVKVNALPEEAHVVVNHRLSVDDSISG
jgi:Gly-Xaa carboxypeptidase